jgi:hypothetical protein
LVYPLINPSGFDLRQRFNADGRDLNAIYHVTLRSDNYAGVQVFYQDALKFTPFEALISIHEDCELEKFYMVGLGKENLDFYHAIYEVATTWIPALANTEIEGCRTDEHGLIMATARDHAFDGALYKKGLTKLAFTLEAPGKLGIHFRVNMMVHLVLQSLHLLNLKRWMASAS